MMSRPFVEKFPPDKGAPNFRLWPVLASYSLKSLISLARSRVRFSSLKAREIPTRNQANTGRKGEQLSRADQLNQAWIEYAMPRVARCVPWRSDCLVQAMAAQDWLSDLGIESQIAIGVENPKDAEFGAHAWLVCGEKIITGGEVKKYEQIL